MSHTHEYEAVRSSYQVQFRPSVQPKLAQHRRRSSTRRQGSAPQSFNGIHRRRRRKFSW
jgi:hypothetical protein